jgi:hypothetical protein
MRAASPLLAMPGGKPRKPRVFAKHPDESGCGAHECALDELPSHPHAGIRSRFLRERQPAPGIFIGFRGPKAQDQQGRKYTRRKNRGAVVAYALMRAASPLLAMPGGKPRKPRVFAKHPDESGCGAHECARHELPSHPRAGSLSRFLRERQPAPGIFIGFRGPKAQDQQGRKYTRRKNRGAVVAYALMRAASPLLAMPGGTYRKPRVFAKHPDESGCGAHECARHGHPSHPRAGSLSLLGKDRPPAGPGPTGYVTPEFNGGNSGVT